MPFNVTTYQAIDTPVHRVDALVKITLVFVYSVALFFVHTWTGLGLLAVLLAGVCLLARIDVIGAVRQLVPLGIIMLVMLLAHAFVLDVYAPASSIDVASAGIFESMDSIALVGTFGFSPAGCARGMFYVLRIVLLVGASLVLTTTTTSTQMANALETMLNPLARFGVPVRDIATIVSIALRFIPLTINQFQQVRLAQVSRGTNFDTGTLRERLRAWQTVLIPLFVGMFRQADNLALAMDARGYGLAQPTRLNSQAFSSVSGVLLIVGCMLCVVIAWLW